MKYFIVHDIRRDDGSPRRFSGGIGYSRQGDATRKANSNWREWDTSVGKYVTKADNPYKVYELDIDFKTMHVGIRRID